MPELFDVLTYDYAKAQDILDVPETYTPIVSMVTPSREAGIYEFGLSLTYNMDTASRSVLLRFTTDGGLIWTEFMAEPKDSTDDQPHFYQFPMDHPGGSLDVQMEMRKETSGSVLDVHFADTWFKRVG